MATTFNTIFNKYKLDPVQARKKSQYWFERQIEKLGDHKPKASELMRGSNSRNRGNALVGNFYFFYYDAKNKNTLPWFDRFPLVLPFSIHDNGFTGLNWHYAPVSSRLYLLDTLLSINNTKLNANTQLQLSWAAIKRVSKFNMAESMVHRYLISHIQSPLKIIFPDEIETALALPVQKFVDINNKPLKANRIWGSI